MALFEGHLAGAGRRFGIVVARFNTLVTERLLSGCLDALRRHGVREEDVDVAWVPGSFEIPLAASRLARSGRYQAVICLGALVRGETPHMDYLAQACARGTAELALETGVPMVFGVLTCDTLEQALERAGAKAGNKGAEAAHTALEMADLLARLEAAEGKR